MNDEERQEGNHDEHHNRPTADLQTALVPAIRTSSGIKHTHTLLPCRWICVRVICFRMATTARAAGTEGCTARVLLCEFRNTDAAVYSCLPNLVFSSLCSRACVCAYTTGWGSAIHLGESTWCTPGVQMLYVALRACQICASFLSL